MDFGSNSDGVPPPKKIVVMRSPEYGARAGAMLKLRNQRARVFRLRPRRRRVRIEIAVRALRLALRNMNVKRKAHPLIVAPPCIARRDRYYAPDAVAILLASEGTWPKSHPKQDRDEARVEPRRAGRATLERLQREPRRHDRRRRTAQPHRGPHPRQHLRAFPRQLGHRRRVQGRLPHPEHPAEPVRRGRAVGVVHPGLRQIARRGRRGNRRHARMGRRRDSDAWA